MSLFAAIVVTNSSTVGTVQYGTVNIDIYDSSTNSPTNGNNAVVSYSQNISGVTTNKQVTVPGLSVAIFTGKLVDYQNGYYASFSITGISGGTPTDDLTVTNIVTTPESYLGAHDGTATVIATSSYGPITYALANPQVQNTTGIFTGLGTGSYSVFVSDTLGIAQLITFTIPLTNPGTSDLAITKVVCTNESYAGAKDGTLNVYATSSYGPIQYSIDNRLWYSTAYFTGLSAGQGTVYVKDTNKGSVTSPYTVGLNGSGGATDLNINSIAVTSETSIGALNGTATVNATSSYGPIQYSLNNSTWQSSNVFTGLAHAVYTVYVKDTFIPTKTVIQSFTILVNASNLAITGITGSNESYAGAHNGSILVTATSSYPPIKYSLDNVNFQTSNLFTRLSAGTYTVYVIDANGGFKAQSYTVVATPGFGPDDLSIVSIVPTNETGLDAADGTVTINATSTYPPIQYSLDNVIWQNSNIFINQPSGAGTAYVKDVNSGFLSGGYTVGTNQGILISDPSVNIGGTNISNWNAAFNPIWYKFQRKDFAVASVSQYVNQPLNLNVIVIGVVGDMTNVNERTIVFSNISGVSTITTPGDFVYIKTKYYSGSYEVVLKNQNSLVLNCPFTQNDTTGFVNINSLRPKYQIQLYIKYVDVISGNFKTATIKGKPDSTGYCEIDISSLMQSILNVKDGSNYNLINYRDANLSASYTVRYAEIWTGNTPNILSIGRPYYIIFAAMQLQQNGGGNLQDYVTFLKGIQPAKWLTDFVNPVYNPSFPFDLSFIFSEYLTSVSPFYNITLLDINKNPLSQQISSNGYLINNDGTFILNTDPGKFIIANSTLSNVPLVQQVGLNRLYISPKLPSNCAYLSIKIQYTLNSVTYDVTKPLICRIDNNTPDRQVYLRWIGLTGSWNYYTFAYNQSVSFEVSEPVTIKNYITDWKNTDTIEDVISRSGYEKISVYGENISKDDLNALEGLFLSPKVQLLTNTSPIQWQTVIVAGGSYHKYETMLNFDSFNLTLAKPSINIQRQ